MSKLKGFTLFEIIISLILISILYLFAINKFNLTSKDINKLNLSNLKEELISYGYDSSISIKCIKKDYSCFVFIDGELQENKITGLFFKEPIVYKYNERLEQIEYEPLELEKLEREDIIFEYSCNEEKKCTELIAFVGDNGYIFNDIYLKPIKVRSIGEVEDYFLDKIEEVKDAF